MQTEQLFQFIRERHRVWEKRSAGLQKPWTDDPILRTYKFTNVYRELDRVTVWLTENWREPHFDDPDLWFAMVIARHFNHTIALEELGWPVPFNRDRVLSVMDGRRLRGETSFSAAYMIGTSGCKSSKTEYLCDRVFWPMWEQRNALRPKMGDTLNSYHIILGQLYGLASFLAAQVVADIKYVSPLREASDWWTFAASGPGSRRGLNRVLDRDVKSVWQEDDWRMSLATLRQELLPMFESENMPTPHAQDVQNCLCEYDKRERVRLGQGRPKQKYPGV